MNALNNLYSEINHRKMGKHREMEKANLEKVTYSDFLRDQTKKQKKLEDESAKFIEHVSTLEGLSAAVQENEVKLAELHAQMEELKQKLESKTAEIMEVGGADYRRLKEELDHVRK